MSDSQYRSSFKQPDTIAVPGKTAKYRRVKLGNPKSFDADKQNVTPEQRKRLKRILGYD